MLHEGLPGEGVVEGNGVTLMAKGRKPFFRIICAMDNNRGIGWKNGLPWPHIKMDRDFYITKVETPSVPGKKIIHIMGRLTFESRPTSLNVKWQHRVINIVMSRTLTHCPDHVSHVVGSFEDALKVASSAEMRTEADDIWIIGGQAVYEMALKSPLCERVYLTRVHHTYTCDTYIAQFEHDYKLIREPGISDSMQLENGVQFKFEVYERK